MSRARSTPARRSRLARVHIAKKELGLDDATYRDVIERLHGVRSAGVLDLAQLDALLAEFRRKGWSSSRRRPTAKSAEVRLLYVLWRILRDGGEARTAKPDAWVARQTRSPHKPEGVQRPEFLRDDEARALVEQLKKWIRRVGLGDRLKGVTDKR